MDNTTIIVLGLAILDLAIVVPVAKQDLIHEGAAIAGMLIAG